MVIATTYVKTSFPQPAIAVKSLGEKSLAGLTAYPQLYPNEVPMTQSSSPMARGFIPT